MATGLCDNCGREEVPVATLFDGDLMGRACSYCLGLALDQANGGMVPGSVLLNAMRDRVHKANEKWWISIEDGTTRLKRNKGELLMLIVSEISEAMEGERKNLPDDKLPHRPMAEVELADAIIRILDYAGGFNYDIGGAFLEKMEYNRTREDHTHEARRIAHGKQF